MSRLTVYYGRFIQLPRVIPTTPPPSPFASHHGDPQDPSALCITHGVLWVSRADGRIQGVDWEVATEDQLAQWLQRRRWRVVASDCEMPDSVRDADPEADGEDPTVVRLVKAEKDRNQFFFPGFIDTHLHASQYPNLGLFGSSTLLEWLKRYTFPLEASLSSSTSPSDPTLPPPTEAHRIYERVVDRTLAHGTTCAAYFATIHVPATNLLANICYRRGQRAFIGRVCMDNRDFCPPDYHDLSASDSVAATEATIQHVQTLDPGGILIQPIITPRFAPTCSRIALAGLGRLAASFDPPLAIQTHISENGDEVALVGELFPDQPSYAHVYDSFQLLTPRTILAHAVYLTPIERALIRSRHAKISHCPASNSALGSGLCPVRTLLDDGLVVGLGTDVSGGYSLGILEAVRQACLVSRLVSSSSSSSTDPSTPGHHHHSQDRNDANTNTNLQSGDANRHHHHKQLKKSKKQIAPLSIDEALYLATRGGAQVVNLSDHIGGFEVGMCWDAQLIELGQTLLAPSSTLDRAGRSLDSNVDLFGWESWPEKIAKWVWNGDDRNVRAVWVNGRLVHGGELEPESELES